MCRYLSIILAILLLSIVLLSGASSQESEAHMRSINDLKAEVVIKLDLDNPYIADTAMTIAADYPGNYNINQVTAIYNILAYGGWYYYSDSSEIFQNANLTLQRGKISNTIGRGDCNDFAILMASLIQSIGGSTRIIFAYDRENKRYHAYTELYLGRDGTSQVEDILSWLKEEYTVEDIPGTSKTGDDIWLNLDWGSNYAKAAYPGSPYFGDESQKTIREVIWESNKKLSPKIVPLIDSMDSTDSWEIIKNSPESAVNISSTPGKRGNGIQISYDLKEGGWVEISKQIDPALISESTGLSFNYFCIGNQKTIEFRLVYDNGTAFGVSWAIPKNDAWLSQKALYTDFKCLNQGENHTFNKTELDIGKIEEIEFILRSPNNISTSGAIIIDDIQGLMSIPVGSPWARAEEQRKKHSALELLYQSNIISREPVDLISSITLIVESLRNYDTFEGEKALSKSLELLPPLILPLNDSVYAAAFSPDNKTIATAEKGIIKIWSIEDGQEILQMVHYSSYILNSIAFSPDGKMIAAASEDKIVLLWDMNTGQVVARLRHDGPVNSVAFSPEGKWLATASYDKTARLWDIATNKELARMELDSPVTSIVFSPDGKYLATTDWDNRVIIWNTETAKRVNQMEYNDSSSIAFSPDGRMLATAGMDRVVRVRNIQTGEVTLEIQLNEPVNSIAFSPDGKWLATGGGQDAVWPFRINSSGTARIWEVSGGKELARIDPGAKVSYVSFSPDGKMLATISGGLLTESSMNKVKIWYTKTGLQSTVMKHNGSVSYVAFSQDGRKLATASHDGTARVWDSKTGKELARMPYNYSANSIAFSQDGKKLAIITNEIASLWDAENGQRLAEMQHTGLVTFICFSPDGKILTTASSNGTVANWDVNTGKLLSIMEHNDPVNYMVFSQDGKRLATLSLDDGLIRVWNIETGKEMRRMKIDDRVVSLAFSQDGKILTTASRDDGLARVWDIGTGKELFEMAIGNKVESLAFSRDGGWLATADRIYDRIFPNVLVKIWDLRTGRQIAKIECPSDEITYSHEGNPLISLEGLLNETEIEKGITLYVSDVLVLLEKQEKEMDHSGSLVFSPNGKWLAMASIPGFYTNKRVKVWDTETGQQLVGIELNGWVESLAFSPDGNRLATASTDNTAKVWLISGEDLICEACNRLACNLTSKDWWEQYCSICTEKNAYSS